MTHIELTPLDRRFADFILRESGKPSPLLWSVVAMLSRAVQEGDICLDLTRIAGREIRIDKEMQTFPDIGELLAILEEGGFSTVGAPGEFCPLVLDGAGRLYLYRYWKYESDLAAAILRKAADAGGTLDGELLARGLERLFAGFPGEEGETDWQKVAALAALRKNVCIISGGPGTGKTSTVVRIIALLLEQAKGAPLRIALAAPTGKSASRLRESVSSMREALACDPSIKELVPREAVTIHRLLGSIHGSTRFFHSQENPLSYDAVIVDEASMVALPLMAKLVAALRPEARLILLGDRDQLSSVEAGAALGDLCGGGRRETFSLEFASLVAKISGVGIPAAPAGGALPPLADALVVLRRNYRFPSESGIGGAAREVNAGRGREAMAILKNDAFFDAVWRDLPTPDKRVRAFTETVLDGYGRFLQAETADEALRLFSAFRFLCALNGGPYGVEGINAVIESILAARGLIDPRPRWYRGRPVLVTVNDYNLKLFNGDVGITFPDGGDDGRLSVFFSDADGGVRGVSPVRLPAHETCYAMTIHKSQGSEFDRTEMILPGENSAIMTRELIYTGITRAKSGVKIWGKEDIFIAAVSRKMDRKSGLRNALWPAG